SPVAATPARVLPRPFLCILSHRACAVCESRGVSAQQRAVAAAATISWALAIGALLVIGVAERASVGLSPSARIALVTVASVAGLAFGVGGIAGSKRADDASDASLGPIRRRAILGTALSAVALVVVAIGSIGGAASRREAERELQAATDAA